eukprot:COSAG04_NODE_362_length_15842_cov_47.166614_1_plen_88_part_10
MGCGSSRPATPAAHWLAAKYTADPDDLRSSCSSSGSELDAAPSRLSEMVSHGGSRRPPPRPKPRAKPAAAAAAPEPEPEPQPEPRQSP